MAEVYVNKPIFVYRKSKSPDFMSMLEQEVSEDQFVKAEKRKVPTTVTRKYSTNYFDGTMVKNYAKYEKDIKHLYNYVMRNHSEMLVANPDLKDHYKVYEIPKKSGGVRIIRDPDKTLRYLHRMIKSLIEEMFPNCGYHASACAYIKKKNIINCLNKHKKNESKWFLKLDLHSFFDNTNLAMIENILRYIHPFNVFPYYVYTEMIGLIKICMLDGGLPQGTVISPILTNLIMIPFDYEFSKKMRKMGITYTRYADDMLLSSKQSFKYTDVINIVKNTFTELGYYYEINSKKTRYGSIAGKNWNLGLMLNKDNNITIGWRKKKEFKALLTRVAARGNGIEDKVDKTDNQILGLIAYYKMVDRKYTEYVITHISEKFNIDINKYLKHGTVVKFNEEV